MICHHHDLRSPVRKPLVCLALIMLLAASCGSSEEQVLRLATPTSTAAPNTCDCGRDYNAFGQILAPRSQWGEETGESLSDILNENYDEEMV